MRSSAVEDLRIAPPGTTELGLILDTSILIETERSGRTIEDMLYRIRQLQGEVDIALSSVSVVELTHEIYRARTEAAKIKRRIFVEKVFGDFVIEPITFEIAQLAGRIEGEQAAKGVIIAFEDLLIGATALHLGYEVATLNVRHFTLIPELRIASI